MYFSRVAAIKARIRASIASIASQTAKLLWHFAALVCIFVFVFFVFLHLSFPVPTLKFYD